MENHHPSADGGLIPEEGFRRNAYVFEKKDIHNHRRG